MDIEVLYIPDCPGYRPTVDAIRQIVAEDHVKATVKAVEVTNPNTPGFNGSPTVRINGKDIERGSSATTCGGLACRTYVQNGARKNVPPREMIRSAIQRERRMGNLPAAVAPLFAMTAALASLACCLPFGIAGALGAVGLSFYLESKRGWVLGAAALFLALAAFQLYRQRKVQGRLNPLNIVLLSASTVLVAIITLFPDNVALFLAQFNR